MRQSGTVVNERLPEQLLSRVVRTRADGRVELGVINHRIGQRAVLVRDVEGRGMQVLPQV